MEIIIWYLKSVLCHISNFLSTNMGCLHVQKITSPYAPISITCWIFDKQDHDIQDSDAEALSVLVELFVGKSNEWSHVINALNCIDVLQSFAATATSSCGSVSRPILLPAESRSTFSCRDSKGPILRIKGLWHPYALGEVGNGPVPNDIYLGEGTTGSHPRTLLLTGPNMGGKSTLLRATCLAVILAQVKVIYFILINWI